ncbi:antitermination protein [Erwinia tracheiphila]|uniref:Antitermination protein n=1 Tax=Erwinia tracheiphila TaxID=65700 RepID=A0A345CT94_9GAMM|nr:antiterminator Q family protein [Erwinia tracheiphila]AXF76661.1 antitermination protein [Erwinia tracheiphila]EOS96142.1 Phage antitermination protein q [Erwinia tracheiphila PSU-1]UIA84665.1 antitermination protein [Erwinia tracheiphila]UIA86953.1 antitermination protein [Erwinia tracheiphila]UIA93257.1 antitermination protein [Erwinia tracheiphila]
MRDIRAVLKRWGEWAAHEENRSAWPAVCTTFRGVLAGKSSLRPSCTDEDGLIIDACVSRLHVAGRDAEREVLFAYYVLRLSLRDVADLFETNRMAGA